jgi:protein involved in polysaccharide export with SLBB domain
MIEGLRKQWGRWVAAMAIVFAGLLSGCQTGPAFTELPPDATGIRFHIGEEVTVTFVGVQSDKGLMPDHTERIHEDGTIMLPLINSVMAAGKTAGELQKEIHDSYVPKYFPELTVTVKGETTYFYVDGEVNIKGQKEYTPGMTLAKAIAVAGGFTDFAKKSKVRLTRGSQTKVINGQNAIEDPSKDLPIYPGDKIYVPRSPL